METAVLSEVVAGAATKMTVKEFFAAIGLKITESAAKIWAAITTASVASLLKFGLIIGASVAVIALIIKFIKEKRASYKDESKKTVVDRALQVNYADLRNQKELQPTMKKVKKELKKDLKPRTKKKKNKKNRSTVTVNPYVKQFQKFEQKYESSKPKDEEGNVISLRDLWEGNIECDF